MRKILLYIFFVIVIFYFVQTKFNIFDISFDGSSPKKEQIEQNVDSKKEENSTNTVEITNMDENSIVVSVDVADDDAERAQGLSGVSLLGDYEGMLFVMPNEAYHGFWMKDMLIPLDFLFIDQKGFIVDIKEDVSPCGVTVCDAFTASSPFKYVIEVNSGFIKKNRVGIGNSVLFNI